MIYWKFTYYFSKFWTHYRSTIAHISNVKVVSVEKSYDGAGAWSIKFPAAGMVQEGFFTFIKPVLEGIFHIFREAESRKKYLFSFET